MSTQVATILRAAADRIERFGWTQDSSGVDGKRLCVMRAVGFECEKYGDYEGRPDLTEISWRLAKSALERHVRPPGGLMSTWNDQPGRTVDEVLAALRGAADEAER